MAEDINRKLNAFKRDGDGKCLVCEKRLSLKGGSCIIEISFMTTLSFFKKHILNKRCKRSGFSGLFYIYICEIILFFFSFFFALLLLCVTKCTMWRFISPSLTASSFWKSFWKYEWCPRICKLQLSRYHSYSRKDFKMLLAMYSLHIVHWVTHSNNNEKKKNSHKQTKLPLKLPMLHLFLNMSFATSEWWINWEKSARYFQLAGAASRVSGIYSSLAVASLNPGWGKI